ncbi:MAG: hypothetical protein Q8P31_06735 [Bacillota bacterium]|nr:hypothetical protein [Bacillota bacterium]
MSHGALRPPLFRHGNIGGREDSRTRRRSCMRGKKRMTKRCCGPRRLLLPLPIVVIGTQLEAL